MAGLWGARPWARAAPSGGGERPIALSFTVPLTRLHTLNVSTQPGVCLSRVPAHFWGRLGSNLSLSYLDITGDVPAAVGAGTRPNPQPGMF